jgi:transcriptional regulator with XRE-family HTH domain
MQMNSVLLGKEIKRLRKIYGISQKQLSEGVCTQPAISGIEAGKVYPSIDILYSLSLRLKVTLDYFIKILLNDTQNYINETFDHIEKLLKFKNYQEAYELCSFELKQQSRSRGYKFDQFINWTHTITSYYLQYMNWEESIHRLNGLEDTSHPLFGQDFQDMKIKNSIAIIYAENKKYEESLVQYNEILSFKDFLHQQPDFHIKVHYNLAKIYFLKEQYERSLDFTENGINISINKEDSSMLGQLFFQQGLCFEKLNRSVAKIKESYRRSLFMFEILKRETYIEMVLEQKSEFLNITN